MNKIYKVNLTAAERQTLNDIVSKGKHSSYKIQHAHTLLSVDESDGRIKDTDAHIAQHIHCHYNTIYNVKQRFVEAGFDTALERKQREKLVIEAMFDGRKEAELIQIACSAPP